MEKFRCTFEVICKSKQGNHNNIPTQIGSKKLDKTTHKIYTLQGTFGEIGCRTVVSQFGFTNENTYQHLSSPLFYGKFNREESLLKEEANWVNCLCKVWSFRLFQKAGICLASSLLWHAFSEVVVMEKVYGWCFDAWRNWGQIEIIIYLFWSDKFVCPLRLFFECVEMFFFSK